MTVTVANTTNTNTMEYWLNRTNELATAMSNVVVTTNSNTAAGNAAITGSFTANVLIANTVRVSNSSVNVVIGVPNTTMVSSGDYFLNANGSWSPIVTPIVSGSYSVSNTSLQEIDSFDTTLFNAAEYFIHLKNNTANGYQASKILVVHNGNTGSPTPNAYSTEYAIVVSNGSLGTFTTSSNGTHVSLMITPGFSSMSINFSRVNF